jgi:hypothetical protein
MKLRLNLIRLAVFTLLAGILFTASCTKEKSGSGTSNNEEQQRVSLTSSEADGECELIFNNIFDDAMGASDDVGMAGTGIFGRPAPPTEGGDVQRPNGCFVVTVTHLNNTTPFPVRIVIDFGTAGCQGTDGHTRSGKIITEYSSRLILPGAIASTTFEDFYVDSTKVEGTLKISNTGTSTDRQFTVEVIEARLSRPSGNYTKWNSQKTITQIEGIGTPNLPLDDILKVEGSANGEALRGNLLVAWEGEITEPLIKRFNCRWFVRGQIRQNRANSSNNSWSALLDFGNGTCDNQAVVTINGVAHNITLH